MDGGWCVCVCERRVLIGLQVNRMNIVEQMLEWKADGIITDCTCAWAGVAGRH